MKIVHIITRLILGGAQENTILTCRELSRRGHDVTLITGPALGPEGGLFEQVKNESFKTIVIDSLRRQINPFVDIPAYRKIKRHLAEITPDIVHTHSAKAGILGRFAAYNLRKSAVTPRIVHTIHGLSFHNYQVNLLNRFYIAVEKKAAAKTDFFISVADAMTKQALAAGIGRPEKYRTAYSAIEIDNYKDISKEQKAALRQKYNIPSDAVVLATVARLFHLKGHNYIIGSAKTLSEKYPRAVWLFVGDGILTDKYKRQIRDLGLADRFIFTGLVDPGRIPLILSASDILVHCSVREGLARAIPQAMLCGIPAVAFDLDGSCEVVNENTGRLIHPENIAELINACRELIEDKELREKLGTAGRESVKEKFSPDAMVDIIEGLYMDLLVKQPL